MPPSFTDPPTEALFAPGLNPGLYLLGGAAPSWRAVPGGTFSSIVVSDDPAIDARWQTELRRIARHRRFSSVIELNTRPAVMENATFIQSSVAIGDQWLLNGVAGGRLLTRYSRARKAATPGLDFNAALDAHFARARKLAGPIQPWNGPVAGLDFAIEARNLGNYYHFMKETFCHLCLIDEIEGFDGRVFIHAPGGEPAGFILRYIEALFPELADRVVFAPAPHSHEQVLGAFNPDYYLFQAPDHIMEPPDALAGHRVIWDRANFTLDMLKTLAMNSYSRSLDLLRKRALRAIEGQSFDHLPRRFWVGRKAEGQRDRQIEGGEALVAALQARGFAVVCFEDLSPLEQIALLARAEVMVSQHGAGFTNILWANPGAHVIELCTLQTCLLGRWADFLALANAAQTSYTLAVADFDHDGPEGIPPVRGRGLHRIAISPAGVDKLMAHIDAL